MKINKFVLGIVFGLGIIGFISAAFLAIEHFRGVVPPCAIEGCEIVTTSVYSTIFGIPISLFGAIFYLVVLGSLVAYIDLKKESFFYIAGFLSLLGAVISAYLIYLQMFVIGAYCVYCITSDVATIVIAIILNTFILRRYFELMKTRKVQ